MELLNILRDLAFRSHADGTRGRRIDVAFSSRSLPVEKSMHRLQTIFLQLAPPTWHAKDVGGNDTYVTAGDPFYSRRVRGCGKSGIERSTQGDYPGSGRK